ncbi:TIGR03943 family putative permease subunit [Cytobacillus sp. FJAT-54145]|uniref:TIGR03943 family putative permease subunit n=1 Tax=Cytobacillus spartinae TaxID=3299023 RepID=A0ABW6KGT4_9BACI
MERKAIMFLRGVILLGFTMLIFKLMITGEIANFIAPRMYPFMYFAIAVFLLLGIIQIWTSSSKKNDEGSCSCCSHDHHHKNSPLKNIFIYSVFVIPILTGFAFSDQLMDSSIVQKRGITFAGTSQASEKNELARDESAEIGSENEKSLAEQYLEDPDKYMEELDERVSSDSNEVEDDVPIGPPDGYYDEMLAELVVKDKIVVTDDQFIQTLNVLEMHIEEFQGKEIEIKGFVYREDGFLEDEAVVARFGMSCCVADASVYGAFSTGNLLKNIETDGWVEITGTIGKKEYNGYILPYIQVTSLNEIDPPKEAYVYEEY